MFENLLNSLGLMTAKQAAEMAQKAVVEKYPEWYLEYAGAHQYDVPSPEYYAAQADLMTKVSYLYTVITLTAQSAASCDFDIFDLSGNELEDHILERLLKAPNQLQTGFEFLRDHFTYKLLTGSSYWWLNTIREGVPPSEIWLIPPGNIEPVPDDKLGIKEYRYYPGDGTFVPLPTWQVVWFRGFHPSNMYASLSGLVPLARTMQTDINTQKFLETVYGPNSGRLPGIIAFKSPVNDVDWRNIKKDIKRASQEGNYMMLRGVGDSVTWLQAAGTLSEMETLQGRRMTKEDIYDTFAPGLMNMTSVNSTEANAVTGKKTFAEFTLYPLLVDTTQKVNKDLTPVFGNVKLEFDDPRDLKASADAAKMTLESQRAGVFTQYKNAGLSLSLAAELAGLEIPDGMTLDTPAPTPAPEPTPPAPIQAEIPDTGESAMVDALLAWRKFAQSKPMAKFENANIPPALSASIRAALKSGGDVNAVFDQAIRDIPIIVLAMSINRMSHG